MDLTEATDVLRAVLGQLSDRAQATLYNLIEQLPADADETLIALLKQYLPDLINAYADNAADYTTVWYGDLAPEAGYQPELPPTLIPEERIFGSIEWAVHTATDVTAAAAKLAGSVDRMVYDASRAVVEHNAIKEKVKYARVARPGLPVVPADGHPRRGVHLGGELDQGTRFLPLRRGAGAHRHRVRPPGSLQSLG